MVLRLLSWLPRDEDLENYFYLAAATAGLSLFVFSLDLAKHPMGTLPSRRPSMRCLKPYATG